MPTMVPPQRRITHVQNIKGTRFVKVDCGHAMPLRDDLPEIDPDWQEHYAPGNETYCFKCEKVPMASP